MAKPTLPPWKEIARKVLSIGSVRYPLFCQVFFLFFFFYRCHWLNFFVFNTLFTLNPGSAFTWSRAACCQVQIPYMEAINVLYNTSAVYWGFIFPQKQNNNKPQNCKIKTGKMAQKKRHKTNTAVKYHQLLTGRFTINAAMPRVERGDVPHFIAETGFAFFCLYIFSRDSLFCYVVG